MGTNIALPAGHQRIPSSDSLGISTVVENGHLSEPQVAYFLEQFKGCPDEDIQAFFWTVEHYGLNPYGVAQVYGIPRTVNVTDNRGQSVKQKRLTIQVGINGLVAIAQRTGRYGGMTEPEWCGEDGVWRKFWNRAEWVEEERKGRNGDSYVSRKLQIQPPEAARVGVAMRGSGTVSWQVANWFESADFDTAGRPRNLWSTKPAMMLAKTAAALALRRTFQDEFASLKAEFTVREDRPHYPAQIADLYPTEPERPRLVQGFVMPDEDEPEEAPEPVTPPTAASSQPLPVSAAIPRREPTPKKTSTSSDGDPTAFWGRARELRERGIDLPANRDWSDTFECKTVLEWLHKDDSRTWDDAITTLNAKWAPETAEISPEWGESLFAVTAHKAGYANTNAAMVAVRQQFDNAPWASLIETYGWQVLIETLAQSEGEPDPSAVLDAALNPEGAAQGRLVDAPVARAASARGA